MTHQDYCHRQARLIQFIARRTRTPAEAVAKRWTQTDLAKRFADKHRKELRCA